MNRFRTLLKEGNPHGNLPARPAAREHWDARSAPREAEGLSSGQALVAHLGLLSLEALNSLGFCLTPHVSYCAHCFQIQFCFWETERKSVSVGRFWCFPAQWKFQKRHPHAVCYMAKVIFEIPVKWKYPHLRSSLTPWEFYPWCGKENKKLRIKSWCEILCRALGKFHHLSATELGINRQLPKSDCSTRLVRLLRYSTVAAGQNHA